MSPKKEQTGTDERLERQDVVSEDVNESVKPRGK